jgi:hypothetical protein
LDKNIHVTTYSTVSGTYQTSITFNWKIFKSHSTCRTRNRIHIRRYRRGSNTTITIQRFPRTSKSILNSLTFQEIVELLEGNYPVGSVRYTSPRKFRLSPSLSSPSISSINTVSPTSSRISRFSGRINAKQLMKRDLSFSSLDPRQSDSLSNAQVSMFFNPPVPVPSPRAAIALPPAPQLPPPPRIPIERHIALRLTSHIRDQYERAGKFLVSIVMEKFLQDLLLCKNVYLGEAGDVMDTFCLRVFDGEMRASDRAEWSNMWQEVLRMGMEANRKEFITSPDGTSR